MYELARTATAKVGGGAQDGRVQDDEHGDQGGQPELGLRERDVQGRHRGELQPRRDQRARSPKIACREAFLSTAVPVYVSGLRNNGTP